ncbi:MAG: ChaN family lipoprotein [Phycisphaeraceae bacterium]|nr:ChaN family lipoprotein [Phycisphaeraceae bacterium]
MKPLIATVLAACLLLTGCAATTERVRDARAEAAVASPRTLVILRGGDGTPATWEDLIATCGAAEAVLVGEMHGQRVGQAFQAAMFADVLAASPTAAGALEFFERDEQTALDDYLSGVTDNAAFRRAARRTESNYTSGHAAMVEACKAAGRPVIAANASRRYVRLARTDGFDRLRELGPEQKRLFAIPEFVPEGRYRADFFKVMGAENLLDPPADAPLSEADAKRRDNISNMLRSQSVWDWTMAESVAPSCRSSAGSTSITTAGWCRRSAPCDPAPAS